MAKRKVNRKKGKTTIDGAAQTKKLFTITAVIVVALLILIYWVTN